MSTLETCWGALQEYRGVISVDPDHQGTLELHSRVNSHYPFHPWCPLPPFITPICYNPFHITISFIPIFPLPIYILHILHPYSHAHTSLITTLHSIPSSHAYTILSSAPHSSHPTLISSPLAHLLRPIHWPPKKWHGKGSMAACRISSILHHKNLDSCHENTLYS